MNKFFAVMVVSENGQKFRTKQAAIEYAMTKAKEFPNKQFAVVLAVTTLASNKPETFLNIDELTDIKAEESDKP